jgi:hypothetical protein
MSERDDMMRASDRQEEPEADFNPSDVPEDRIGEDPMPDPSDSDSEVQT